MTLVVGPRKKDVDRIIGNLALTTKAVEFSVRSALRRSAQATVTTTRRKLSAELNIRPQKLLKKRLGAFAVKHVGRTTFRAWLGVKQYIDALESPHMERQAQIDGAFLLQAGPRLRRGWYKRALPFKRVPLRRWRLSLEPGGKILEDEARFHWRVTYRERLNRELQRRLKKARTPQEARSLTRALTANLSRLRTEGRLPDD